MWIAGLVVVKPGHDDGASEGQSPRRLSTADAKGVQHFLAKTGSSCYRWLYWKNSLSLAMADFVRI
jgi:hypothetical protein